MGEKGVSRRVFLTTAASGVGAAALLATGGVALAAGTPAPAAPAPAPPAAPAAGKIWPSQPGRIVAVHHAGAMEKMEKPRLDVVGQMVDRGLLEFTGKSDLAAAWSQFVEPADVVEIKINCLGQRHNSSNAETVQAILRGLQAAGVKRENILIYDLYGGHLRSTRESLFRPDGKLVGYGEQWGYNEETLRLGGVKTNLAKILDRVTAVINVPVMKSHDNSQVTGALKNMTHGHVKNPGGFHKNNCAGIPHVYSHPKIKDKVRLNIMDGLRLLYHGGPQDSPKHKLIHNTLYFATDPVALDSMLFDVIQDHRKKYKVRPLIVPSYLPTAEQMGLGVFDRAKIQITPIELQA
ncbi:MAG: DUF362 domain-containing protein [Myxococcota bacterium]|jgi:uncharacterized protein (DUF362 family)|nr:DUF362 domain-containing protein [Myxococcota bacterium]